MGLVVYIIGGFSSNRHFVPRGIGWIVVPVMVGVALAKLVPEKGWGIPSLNHWPEPVAERFRSFSLSVRVGIVGSAFWALAVILFVILFQPYGSYMSDNEFWKVIKAILFPPILGVVGYFAYTKMIKDEKNDDET